MSSPLIELVIADLCLETIYKIDVDRIDIAVTVLGPQVLEPFDRPTTELAEMMGVANICGSVTYELIKQSGPN